MQNSNAPIIQMFLHVRGWLAKLVCQRPEYRFGFLIDGLNGDVRKNYVISAEHPTRLAMVQPYQPPPSQTAPTVAV